MSPQIRLAALAALTLLLTACPTTMPSRQGQSSHTHNHTPAPYNPNLATGNAVSHGTTLQPTGSSATYRAVSFQELPQWNEQSFGESLAAFQKPSQMAIHLRPRQPNRAQHRRRQSLF